MGDRLSHCCCGGCDLWTITLPVGADSGSPPAGFGYTTGAWTIDRKLPSKDWRILFDFIDPTDKYNPTLITIDNESSSDTITLQILPEILTGTIAKSKLIVQINTDPPFVVRSTADLATQSLRGFDLILSGDHLYIDPEFVCLIGDPEFTSTAASFIWQQTQTGKTYNGLTGLLSDTADANKRFAVHEGYGFVLPVAFSGGSWSVSWQAPAPNVETLITASRWSADPESNLHDCPRNKNCEVNSPYFGGNTILADIQFPGLAPTILYAPMNINRCESNRIINYVESRPLDTLSTADFIARQNLGTIVGKNEPTGDRSNPANWDLSLPARPSRSYTSEPQIRYADLRVTLLEKKPTTMRLYVDVRLRMTTRSFTDVSEWIYPTGVVKQQNGSFIGIALGGGSSFYHVRPQDIPIEFLEPGYATLYGMGWNYFGQNSTLYGTGYANGELIYGVGEVEVPLFTDINSTIAIPLASIFDSQTYDVLTGESISIDEVGLDPVPHPTYFKVKWKVTRSQTTVPLDPSAASLIIRPNDVFPFVQ